MELKRLPMINPEDTCVWLDLEGVLMEKHITFYLLSYNPLLTIKSILKSFVKAFSNKIRKRETCFFEELIKECKKMYESELKPHELYKLGRKISEAQSSTHKTTVMNLLKILKEDGYDVYLLTKAEKTIAQGFMDSFPEELRPEKEKIITTQEKDKFVEDIKSKTRKKVIGIGDTKYDEEALRKSDVACVVSSSIYKLFPPRIEKGYKFKNLAEVKSFFDAMYFQKQFEMILKI